MRNSVQHSVFAAALVVVSVTLTGCSSLLQGPQDASPPSGEIEYGAEIHNASLKDDVDTLLSHIDGTEWDRAPRGHVRTECGAEHGATAHRFFGSWFTQSGAVVPDDAEMAEAAASDLAAWLEGEGWGDVELFEFSEAELDVNAYGVGGSRPESGIEDFQVIYFFEGDLDLDYPYVGVDVDSGCLHADLGTNGS